MKVFVDSSLLVEYEKLNRPELLEILLSSNHRLFINPVVASEYLYQLLGILGGRSPMSICESGKIGETLGTHDTAVFLSAFEVLPIHDQALPMAIDLMKKHNLLPNDAIILASCKLEQVAVLASFDTDFADACRAESIELISNVSDLS